MTSRLPLVLGSDGLPQQLQSADTISVPGLTTPSATSANIALPGGYFIKSGQVTSTSGGVASVTFPVAFPNACISVVATVAPLTASTLSNYSVAVVSFSKTGFTLQVNNLVTTILLVISTLGGVSTSVHWTAIGY